MSGVVAAGGAFLLGVLAPFETNAPLLRLPGQSVSNLEAALLLACVAWLAATAWTMRLPQRHIPLAGAWITFVVAMAIAAGAAGERTNALHMVGRLAAAGAVYVLVVEGITTPRRLHTAVATCVAAGVAVAVLAALEYVRVPAVLAMLRLFRPAESSVGAQMRAGGPLQYPTIASMYLEIVFAFGIGLMVDAVDRARRFAWVWFAAVVVIAEGIIVTFTRAGIVAMAVTLLFVGATRWRVRAFDRGVRAVGALGVAIVVMLVLSRPSESLWLRMTSEGQGAWYSAAIEAPPSLTFGVDETLPVSLSLANSGRLEWNSSAEPQILFSYHWLDESGTRVVAFEGGRTSFDRPIAPGERTTVHALVRAPRQPGRYRLQWDLVQEGHLWFSTEPDAPDPVWSTATVSGVGHGGPLETRPAPVRAVRPGRMVLWRAALRMAAAHPILGVGPDNFRLLYGSFAGLPRADVRTHSNNMYLEVLAGGGSVGFAAFAFFAARAYRLFASVATRPLNPLAPGIGAAGIAIALHGTVDSFLSFAPTYVLFALTFGFAAAIARGAETRPDAHRV